MLSLHLRVTFVRSIRSVVCIRPHDGKNNDGKKQAHDGEKEDDGHRFVAVGAVNPFMVRCPAVRVMKRENRFQFTPSSDALITIFHFSHHQLSASYSNRLSLSSWGWENCFAPFRLLSAIKFCVNANSRSGWN